MRLVTRLSASLIVVASFAVLAAPAESGAQSGFGTRPTAGIFGGVTFPRGDFNSESGIGWHAGALAKMRAYKSVDVRVDGTYSKLAKKSFDLNNVTFSTDAAVTFGTLNALINLGTDSAAYPGDNSASPYLVAGLGLYALDAKFQCAGTASACAAYINPGAENDLGFNVGFGTTVPLAGIRTFIEGRYHRISTSDDYSGARTMILVSAGVKFR
jgi:opacity protein-like surface antigen